MTDLLTKNVVKNIPLSKNDVQLFDNNILQNPFVSTPEKTYEFLTVNNPNYSSNSIVSQENRLTPGFTGFEMIF